MELKYLPKNPSLFRLRPPYNLQNHNLFRLTTTYKQEIKTLS